MTTTTIAWPQPIAVVTSVPSWCAVGVYATATAVFAAVGAARTTDHVGAANAAAFKRSTNQVASRSSSPPV